nr:hypothetical protein SCRaV_80L [Siniperca chuatsi ranavirus]
MPTIKDWLNLQAPIRCVHVQDCGTELWKFIVNDSITLVSGKDTQWTCTERDVNYIKGHSLYVEGKPECWQLVYKSCKRLLQSNHSQDTTDDIKRHVLDTMSKRVARKRVIEHCNPCEQEANLLKWTKNDWYGMDLK